MLTNRNVVLNLGFLAAWALIGAVSAVGAMSAAVSGGTQDPRDPPPTFWIEELTDDDDV